MANEKRLIDLDKLVAHFRATKIDEVFPNWKELFPSTQAAIIRLTTKYRAIVLNAPIVDAVEVVHGKWVKTKESLGWNEVDCVECYICHESWLSDVDDSFDYLEHWHFCPNCGAKMDGDGNA